MALPPIVPVKVPRPLVGVEDIEYAALTLLPKVAPLGAPMSSVPVIVPEGLVPFAVNTPEKIDTPTVAGIVADPAYVHMIALFVNGRDACGSPNPNRTEL